MKKVLVVWAFLSLVFSGFSAFATQSHEASFNEWLVDFKKEAIAQGISDKTVSSAFKDAEFISEVIALDRKQPEHKITMQQYLAKTVNQTRIENGRALLKQNHKLLNEISEKYDVPAPVIVALWGMETSYGDNTGNFNIISSLATLAYEGRRSSFFKSELLNSLKILEQEKMNPEDFYGSWAGAFGQCQFMPSSYLKYAVDFDKDGKRDIWYTEADIFASIANYLSSEGWDAKEGIKEGNNNFKVLLKWNRSRYFATAIAELVEGISEK